MSKEYLPGTIFQFNSPNKKLDASLNNLPVINYNSRAPTPFASKSREKPVKDPYAYKDILHQSKQSSPFSILYFSQQNIDEVQTRIRNKVYNLTNGLYKINNQSETNVVLVMREVYLKYARDELDVSKFKESIDYLDNIASDQISATVIKNIKEHVNYIRDKKNAYGGTNRVLPLSENTSLAGLKNYD